MIATRGFKIAIRSGTNVFKNSFAMPISSALRDAASSVNVNAGDGGSSGKDDADPAKASRPDLVVTSRRYGKFPTVRGIAIAYESAYSCFGAKHGASGCVPTCGGLHSPSEGSINTIGHLLVAKYPILTNNDRLNPQFTCPTDAQRMVAWKRSKVIARDVSLSIYLNFCRGAFI